MQTHREMSNFTKDGYLSKSREPENLPTLPFIDIVEKRLILLGARLFSSLSQGQEPIPLSSPGLGEVQVTTPTGVVVSNHLLKGTKSRL